MLKNYLPIVLPVVLFLVGLGFLGFTYYKSVSNKPAALSITSKYKEADVKLRGNDVGKTPIEDTNTKPGNAELVMSTDLSTLSKQIILTAQALTAVTADVGVSDTFSGSMIVWYDKTNDQNGKLFISSDPAKAKIIINGKEMGETPTTFNGADLAKENEGGEYSIVIEKEGYDPQKITVKLEDGYTLNIDADMFLKPIPKQVSLLDDTNLYKIYGFSDEMLRSVNPAEWASAIAYWLDTRGTAVIGSDSVNYIDYFVDSDGNLYTGKGDGVSKDQVKLDETPDKPIVFGYLNKTDESSITENAKSTIAGVFGSDTPIDSNTYIVKPTEVGYLNVRKTADVDGEKLGELKEGESVTVVELSGEWYKIKYAKGENGEAFVYATYLEKKPSPTPNESEPSPTPSPSPTEAEEGGDE